MSVPKNKRYKSPIEFISNAEELLKYTIHKCAGFPKRYTFYVTNYIVEHAHNISDSVTRGNFVPKNKYELQKRVDFLLFAYSECENIVKDIKLAKEIFDIKDGVMIYWMELVDKELKLIDGAIKSSRSKYEVLPDGPISVEDVYKVD